MRRYELKSTMMTSNRPLEDWGKLIGDVPAATAILDRFLHRAELIHITGKSYRLRDRNDTPPPKPENKKRRGRQDKDAGDAA
jgi:DNA replication protein DnaC